MGNRSFWTLQGLGLLLAGFLSAQNVRVYAVADFGLRAGSKKHVSAVWPAILKKIKAEC